MYHVVKADGTREEFSEEKVLSSMQRAGVPHELRQKLLSQIKHKLSDNMQTWEIYQDIIDSLGKSEHPYFRARYGLKQAIMMLGPTGYPFEDFVSAILQTDGYATLVRQMMTGTCVIHEVDVIAVKDKVRTMIEVKFHNNPGARSDLQVAMYTKARFDDLKDKNDIAGCWLLTNTKVTTDAIAYAKCTGVNVMSWNYPEGGSLRELIEKNNMHPITMLSSIPHALKLKLLEQHVVLCRDVCLNRSLINTLQLSKEEKSRLLSEVEYICQQESKHHTHTASLHSQAALSV